MTRIPFLRLEKYIVPADTRIPTAVVGYHVTIDGTAAPWVELTPDGMLHIREGFSWDGPSGPAIDTAGTMRPSLAHDALYLLIRSGTLPWSCRAAADETYRILLIANGVWPVRAAWQWLAVRLFGGFAISGKRQTLALLGKES